MRTSCSAASSRTGRLAAAKNPLNPVELKAALKKAGHPSKSDSALYTQIFAIAKKEPALKNTATGYALKG